ncbi:hypothetical protein [Aliikangiella sp. IMCC44359]|uniref:hypothetical protein n=1 Tax=Aliikangiella sp. IMCC44359 TaxID=3459125 RepID=UPI00403A9D4B
MSNKKYPPPYSLRLSDEERKHLKELADGKPLASYIKAILFGESSLPKYRKRAKLEDEQLLIKLLAALGKSRIASNINQLAKAANSGSLPVNHDIINALNEAVAAIKWMRESLIKGIGLKSHDEDK